MFIRISQLHGGYCKHARGCTVSKKLNQNVS